MSARKTVLSAIQPTGNMHLGNYFGAVKNWVDLQEKYTCYYGVVDYHAMTMPYDVQKLRKRLRQGLIDIDKKMRGYKTNKANIIGVESRTSAPIRIPRDVQTYCHPEISGLYPCGEGAGYAGGIISAAMDGQNVVKAIKKWMDIKK